MGTRRGPDQTYRAIIDEIVRSTRSSHGERINKTGLVFGDTVEPPPLERPPRWTDAAYRAEAARERANRHEQNLLTSKLTRSERRTLARLLVDERRSAIHDVLARLTWWMECRDVTWTVRGEPMPVGYEGGLHMDYIGRLGGWKWPALPAAEKAARRAPAARRTRR